MENKPFKGVCQCMKLKIVWPSLVVILFSAMEAPADTAKLGPEMILNGGMEAGNPPEKWKTVNDVTLSADVNPGSGEHCLKIIQSGKKAGLARQDVSTVPGKKYELTLKYKCQPDSTARIEGWDHKNGRNLFAEHKTEGVWTVYKYVVTIPSGCESVGILLYAFGSGSVVWYDDVSFKAIEE